MGHMITGDKEMMVGITGRVSYLPMIRLNYRGGYMLSVIYDTGPKVHGRFKPGARWS